MASKLQGELIVKLQKIHKNHCNLSMRTRDLFVQNAQLQAELAAMKALNMALVSQLDECQEVILGFDPAYFCE
jgi:hypothetical protein